MKIIKRKADGVVIYAGGSLELSASGATNGNWVDAGTTTANAMLVDVPGIPPNWIGGAYKHSAAGFELVDDSLVVDAAAVARATLITRIDRDVDDLYAAVVGNRAEEYTEAERQARAYADGRYVDPVPPMVASWAAAKGWAGHEAADDILQQAAQWRAAQEQIRAVRLLRKEQARTAGTVAELQAVAAQWSTYIAAVRQQLGA